jgi:hypothetical protein
MCSNCGVSEGCSCTGGPAFTSCQCEQGEHCPACGHDPDANMTSGTNLLTISDPDLALELIEFE